MKLLKISEYSGHFRVEGGSYSPIDKIGRDDLLRLANWTLEEPDVEFDSYDEDGIRNQVHQIIYKSILQKLQGLRARKSEFVDEAARLYLEDYDRYKSEVEVQPSQV